MDNSAESHAGDKTNAVAHGALHPFLEKHGTKGAEKVMLRLCFLITKVREAMLDILAEQEVRSEFEAVVKTEIEQDWNARTQRLRPVPGQALEGETDNGRRGRKQGSS